MLNTLKELCALPGPSGYEDKVREYIRERVKPFADELIEDTMGNLLVFVKGKRKAENTVMLAAHMDEVGFIITSITDEGYLNFNFAGSIDRRVIIGKRVFVGEPAIPGVIGIAPAHRTPEVSRESVPSLNELCIDIALTKDEAEKLVKPGDYAVFDPYMTEFGAGYFKAKAIDDRIGCTIMLTLIESGNLPRDTWFAFTAQEEVGVRGAEVAANRIQPDFALVLEGTTAADLPSQKGADKVCIPSKGPVIPFMDGGSMYSRELFKLLTALAEKNGIAWQTKTFISGSTDARVIQRSGKGSKVAAISAAVRYIHSPSCVAYIKDFDDIYKLAYLFLENI